MSLPSSGDPKLWLALLREVEKAGGAARPRDLYPRLRAYFPEITDADASLGLSSGNVWANRVQCARQQLASRGCLESAGRPPSWVLTAAGRDWLQVHGKDVSAPGPHLDRGQDHAGTPALFGEQLVGAFITLGFGAQPIPGPGDMDILLTASLGPASYQVVVDVKLNASVTIADARACWPVVSSHRQARGAQHALVVAEAFSGRQHQKIAEQYRITLLSTAMLTEILRLHEDVPFSLVELSDLFRTYGPAAAGLQALQQRHTRTVRRWRLLAEIIDTIDEYEATIPSGFTPRSDQLHLVLTTRVLQQGLPSTQAPTLQDVKDALALLANRTVKVLREVPGSDGAYQLTMRGQLARQRLPALAQLASLRRG